MRLQCTGDWIDAESIGTVDGAGNARSAVARHRVQVARRRMRPGVLDIGRQDRRSALFYRGGDDVDIEKAQLRADAGIKGGLCRHVLTPRAFGVATVSVKNALVAGRLIKALLTSIEYTRFPAAEFTCLFAG